MPEDHPQQRRPRVLIADEMALELLDLVFHSSALMEGCGPFVRSRADEQAFLKRLRTFLGDAMKEGIVGVSLSAAAHDFLPAQVKAAVARGSASLTSNCAAVPAQNI